MTLLQQAAMAVRLRREWLVAIPVLAAMALSGCARHRQSYRPIFATPSSTGVPCTNCGSQSTVTTDEGTTVPESTVPHVSVPSDVDSMGLPAGSRVPSGAGSARSSTVEPVPKAQIGSEPGFEEPAPPAGDQRSSQKPVAPGGGTTPPQGPALQAPKSGSAPSTRNTDNLETERLSAANRRVVRNAKLAANLQAFLGESSASELLYPSKADRPWRYIVLHHSASASGNYDQIDREHRKILGYDGCGYHFVIGNGTSSGDGQIEVAERWNNQKQGVHCRNAKSHDVDEYGIGICLVGDFDQEPPTPRQVAAARALVSYLSRRYRIEPGRVSTHAHLAATPTVCPGKFFPSNSILAAAREAAPSPAVRTSWAVRRVPARRD
jgi:hypothetical protein